jgi:hypothetical protein
MHDALTFIRIACTLIIWYASYCEFCQAKQKYLVQLTKHLHQIFWFQ